MLKKLPLAAVLLIVAAVVVFRFAGVRFAVDGSGMMPRFWSRAPNYDVLEADRSRQREQLPPTSPAAAESVVSPSTPPPSDPAPSPTHVEAPAPAHPKRIAGVPNDTLRDFAPPMLR